MTRSTNILVDRIIEQISELIKDSPILKLKMLLSIYQTQNKEHYLHRSESVLVPSSEENNQYLDDK